jgi:predicted metal-binding protein
MSTIGAKIDQLHALREQKRALEEQVKQLSGQMSELENQLIDQMDSEGVTKSTGNAATVSITTSVKPSVDDWDAFYKYIHRYKYYHLLERRPSVTGCRELLETKGKIPGVVPFTQRKLNIRSI